MTLEECLKDITSFLKKLGFKIEPLPIVVIDENTNDPENLFIKTGYYDNQKNTITLCVNNRHLKDIARTFCHELVHHNQNLEGRGQNISFQGSIYDNKELKEIEREAYEKGNLLFRLYTEYKEGKVKAQL